MTDPSRILVIEDDTLNRKLLRTLLTLGRYEVLEAADAETGIRLARETMPACVLMDLRLPGMDGLAATRIIKSDPELAGVPVVAVTAAVMSGDEQKALDAGCDGYIPKPIDTRAFLDNIRHFLQSTAMAAGEGLAPARPRILVVDDEQSVRRLFSTWLEREGFQAVEAGSGAEALARSHELVPDLILLDIVMPDIDGFEVARRLKASLKTLAVPIILVTGLSDGQSRTKGVEVGADEFLTKPVDPVELVVRIRSMLRLKRVQERLARGARGEEHIAAGAAGKRGTSQTVVLVADQEEAAAGGLEAVLGRAGCRVLRAAGGDEVLALVSEQEVDVLLIGSLRPGGPDCQQLCRLLKDEEKTRNLQIIVISTASESGARVTALEQGADDFLLSPPDPAELTARVRQHAARKARLDALLASYHIAASAAASDGLTGLTNNTEFKRLLDLELKRARRHAYRGALLFIDIDDFKKKNDELGHLVGDMLLAELAGVLKGAVRDIDLAARYGGEEFVVLLPHTDETGALVVAERLRSTVADHRFLEGASDAPGPVTVSVGIACFPEESLSAEQLISRADDRLYQAKRDGKNRVCAASPQRTPPASSA